MRKPWTQPRLFDWDWWTAILPMLVIVTGTLTLMVYVLLLMLWACMDPQLWFHMNIADIL